MPAAGDEVLAADFTEPVWASDGTAIDNISATGYTVGTPEVGVQFTAPTSGRVKVTVGGGARGGSSTERIDLAPQIFEGADATGTEVESPSILARGWSSGEGTMFAFGSRTTIKSGLAENVQHYARVVYKANVGSPNTGDITRREIVIEPLP